MLKQSLNFKLLQKLSPQQIQLMKLIQLPTQAFEQKLKQELEENPALEEGEDEEGEDEDGLPDFDELDKKELLAFIEEEEIKPKELDFKTKKRSLSRGRERNYEKSTIS